MKIVIVDTTLQGPLIGGAQTFLPGLIKGLIKMGNEVHLVTRGKPDNRMAAAIEESGVILHTALWGKKALVQDAAPVFAGWINALMPDIYLISVSPDIGWVALPYLNPAIATFTIGHTDSETFYFPARHYQPFLTNAIGVSDEVCKQYVESCRFLPTAVASIPYGVIANPEMPSEHPCPVLQIIYVGRVVEEQKRISDLIKIAQQLSENQVPFHLKIVGDGPEMPAIKLALQTEIRDNKVELLGWLKTGEVIRHLRQSDLFLLTSAYEGFCIALIEAMANGCCPLVTDIKSGNKQLINNGENGFIYPVGDTESFVEKITTLAANKRIVFSLRKKAWEMGRNFGTERMVTAYLDSFVNGIAANRKNPRITDSTFPIMDSCKSRYPLWLRRLKSIVS